MGRVAITSVIEKFSRLTKREELVVLEIGIDMIDSASAFVSYISESYGFSKSSVWYNLNRLKEKGLLDFATKDEPGKGLSLTRHGSQELQAMVRAGKRLGDMEVMPPNDPIPATGPLNDRIMIANRISNVGR